MKKINTCRCCLNQNCYKDISNEYYWAGQLEVYETMLMNTFNINISSIESHNRLICEECITKLRDATNFKKQILNVEQMILELYTVKEEEDSVVEGLDLTDDRPNDTLKLDDDDIPPDDATRLNENQSDKFDDKISDDFDADDLAWEINEDDIQTDSKGQIFVIKIEPKKECIKPKIVMKAKKEINDNGHPTSSKKSQKAKTKTSQTRLHLRENSLKLILNSNMCLFESLKTRFGCFNCKKPFMTVKELRDHANTHERRELSSKVRKLRGLSYKNVEITDLACSLCSEKCDNLSELRQHLTKTHEIDFFSEEHLLIPYKLEKDFQCVICAESFNTYSRLNIHMNKHFTNNVCEICGESYINRLSLRTHIHSMHREKKCSYCSMTFITTHSRTKHMRNVHNTRASKRYCLLCNKTFRYTYMLVEHRIKEHDAKRPVSNCTLCGKTFLAPQNLRVHMRSVHIKERNYPCSVCSMRFFTKCDQKRHERTHEDTRSFSCSYCEGKFKSKDSWRRHLKRQHGQMDK